MMEFLCAISDDVKWDRASFPSLYEPDNWMATENALTKRGLIKRKTIKEIRAEGYDTIPYRMTDIGLIVVQLLKVGGLFIQADAAKEKLCKRRGRL